MLPFTSITSIKRNKSIAIKKGKEVLADRSYWKTESNAYRYMERRPGNGPVRRLWGKGERQVCKEWGKNSMATNHISTSCSS